MITQSNTPRPSSVEPVELQIQVLVSARVNAFDLVNAIMFFVSVSRAVAAVRVHRFQGALFQAVENNLGIRLSASELLNGSILASQEKERTLARKERLETKRVDLEHKEVEFDAAGAPSAKPIKAILGKLCRSGRLRGGKGRRQGARRE